MSTTVKTTSAVEHLNKISKEVPAAAIVLGSGVEVLEDLDNKKSYSYQEIFGVAPTIAGHSGSLSLGRLDGHLIAVLRGRFHFYEGHGLDVVTLPTLALAQWGVKNLYLTNACGAISPSLHVGDLMLITSYRDLLQPKWRETGLLPSIMASATDCQNKLTERILAVAENLSAKDKTFLPLKQGVYAGLLGPCYETLAEVEMLRRIGADTVGMSTVPELEAAQGTKMQAAAISVITNSWSEDKIHGHEEVLAAAKAASTRLDKLLRAAILGR